MPLFRPVWLKATAGSLGVVALATAIAALLAPHIDRANLMLVYLIAVLVTAVRFGRIPAALASVLSVAAFDFFFVPPSLTFAVSNTQYVITFAVMLATALLVSTLAVRLREQAEEARRRERRTASLYALSRDLADTSSEVELLEAAVTRVRETLDCETVVLVPDPQGRVRPRTAFRSPLSLEPRESGVAQWVFDNRQAAGPGTDTLPSARGLYLPLQTQRGAVGVLGVYPDSTGRFAPPDQMQLLETFANQIALALERSQLAADTERTRLLAESERMRSALLSSVSHDLRTPLAAITGATSTLLQNGAPMSESIRRELLQSVSDEAKRLNRLVANLLEMTRVEAAGVTVRKEWHSIEEVVGAALARVEEQLQGRALELEIPADLPLVPFDEVSIGQVLLNLIENALKYSPDGTPITIRAEAGASEVAVEVMDRGRGIPPGEEERVFEKFYRGQHRSDPGGIGLGLAICRAIVVAHGGSIRALPRAGGGAVLRFTLPLGGAAPSAPEPELEAGEATV